MRKILKNCLYYGLDRDEYKKSIDNLMYKNIFSLRITNAVVAIVLFGFLFTPFYADKNFSKAIFYVETDAIAVFLYLFIRIKYRQINNETKINKIPVYILICLSYANVISFGTYLGVWANHGNIAVAFPSILICALLLFTIPAVLYYSLTICSTVIFIIIASAVKSPEKCLMDIPNVLFAGVISMIIGWHIIMNRLSLSSIARRMKKERDNYFDQSTIDELTQLKNRRDFMNTFQRSLANHRQEDHFICVAILDIDYFKNYNDYYGHPKGDECLRKIGKAFKDMQNKLNIYVARIGGEEFAMIWFEKDIVNVKNVASLVNEKIRLLNIPHEKSSAAPYVSLSIGIYVMPCGVADNIDNLYSMADKALYLAKRNGRNRVVIYSFDHRHAELLRETA